MTTNGGFQSPRSLRLPMGLQRNLVSASSIRQFLFNSSDTGMESVEGVSLFDVSNEKKRKEKHSFFYEFSKSTKFIYLFPVEVNDKTVGVIRVDTSKELRPWVLAKLVLLAQQAAIPVLSRSGRLA